MLPGTARRADPLSCHVPRALRADRRGCCVQYVSEMVQRIGAGRNAKRSRDRFASNSLVEAGLEGGCAEPSTAAGATTHSEPLAVDDAYAHKFVLRSDPTTPDTGAPRLARDLYVVAARADARYEAPSPSGADVESEAMFCGDSGADGSSPASHCSAETA